MYVSCVSPMHHTPWPVFLTGVVKMYEGKLKELNPHVRNITYDISDLFNYVDSLSDLSAMV